MPSDPAWYHRPENHERVKAKARERYHQKAAAQRIDPEHQAELRADRETRAAKQRAWKERLLSRHGRQEGSPTQEKQEYVNQYKLKAGCADCGYNGHPSALDFDHLPGSDKTASVALLVHCAGVHIDQVKKEMAKCEVVCANCHRIRTLRRLEQNRKEKRNRKSPL